MQERDSIGNGPSQFLGFGQMLDRCDCGHAGGNKLMKNLPF